MGNCCGSYGFDCLCPSAAKTNPEVAGFIYNGPGRGMQYLSQIFLLGAFLYHAKRQANCFTDDELQEQGMHPRCPCAQLCTAELRACVYVCVSGTCVRERVCVRVCACVRACAARVRACVCA